MERFLPEDVEGAADQGAAVSTLLGRDRECQRIIEAAKAAADGRCQRLWITGAPGTGKTALCEWAKEHAQSFSVVDGVCVEGESELALGLVVSVVRNLRRHLDEMPEPSRHILTALVEEGLGGDDPFALATSLLALVALAAERRPLLVIVDDVQWIDSASAIVLGFVMRRLDADAVLLLAASRTAPVGLGLGSMAQVIELGGLPDRAASDLLHESGVVSPVVMDAIASATGGVPLAIKEVASQLTEPQRRGLEPLPEPLPVGERLIAAYQDRLAPLDQRTRLAVGVAAAAGSSLQWVPLALSELGLDGDALAPAERARVVSLTPTGPVFPHPLVRTAALTVLAPAERRAVHAALAAACQNPVERAVHLVHSCAGPTESVASEVASIAANLSDRSGPVSAAGVWLDAARLTPPGPQRVSRLLRAGTELASVGRRPEAKQCLDEVMATGEDPIVRAEAVTVLAWLRVFTDDRVLAAQEAASEAVRVERASPGHALRLQAIAAACFMSSGDVERAAAIMPSSLTAPEAGEPGLSFERLIFSVVVGAAGRHAEAARWLSAEPLHEWTQRVEQEDAGAIGQVAMSVTCFTLLLLERFDEAMALAVAGTSRARTAQQPQALPQLLAAQADVLLRTGRWKEAEAAIHEAMTMSEETGQTALTDMIRAFLACLYATRGQESYLPLGNAVLASCARTKNTVAEAYALYALGLGHLGTNRIASAVQVLTRLTQLLEGPGVKSPCVIPYRADHIEALLRAGDEPAAREFIALFEADVERSESRWAAGTCARVKGLLAGADSEADAFFETSVDLLEQHPFDAARSELLWGEALRRRRQVPACRKHLNAAAATFDRLEAMPWAERARRELRATGARTAEPKPSVLGDLTPQEMQVAMTVAEGHTNRETANRLFMSPKTVEHHLSGVYRKLGLRSRAELARLMSAAR